MTDSTEAPAIAAIEAVAETIASPTPAILGEDLLLVLKLVNEVKTKLYGKHPSLELVFQALFNLP